MARAPSVWSFVSKMPPEQFDKLYGGFPQKVRHHLGDWLENQPWEHIMGTDSFCIEKANSVLSKLVEELEKVPKSCGGDAHMILQWVENFKTMVQRDPMSIIQSFKIICKGEMETVLKQYPRLNMAFQSKQEEVMFNFRSEKMQHILKQTSVAQKTLKLAVENVKFHAQVQDLQSLQKKWIFLMEDSFNQLATLQEQTVKRINIWKRQQQMAGNGAPFDENLLPLQDRVEFMFVKYTDLFVMMREIKDMEQRLVPQNFFDQINIGFGVLIKNSFLVDKQPPQVLKTQTKFQASVNFMLGAKILAGVNKMPVIRASIITEKRAQELFLGPASTSETLNDGAGEIENGRSTFEFTQATRTCGAIFKNMLLKKIKRCERKGSESVTEEKCAILFTAEIHFNGSTYIIQAFSLPVVVIVHGNQDNNAKATILWDNAFSETGRRPFFVHEKVPWKKMCATLNMKFISEVGTKHELSVEHFWFLAQKIFGDNCLSYDELKEHSVSWAQFNKEPLRERNFTFWQWFDGVVDLTKKHLKEYWSDGLIMGFVSKQFVHKLLCDKPSGTFLLRFSDSEIGGITIAHVIRGDDGPGQIQNIQPFGAKDLQILSLGDRVKDLKQLTYLYKKGRKDDVFKKYYKNVSNCGSGYKKTAIVVRVIGEESEDCQMEDIDYPKPSTSGNIHYPSPLYSSPVTSPQPIFTSQQVYSNTMPPAFIQTPPYPIEQFIPNTRHIPSPAYPLVEGSSPPWIPPVPETSNFNGEHISSPAYPLMERNSPPWITSLPETQDFNSGNNIHGNLEDLLTIIENDSSMSNMSHFSQAIINEPTPMQEDWPN